MNYLALIVLFAVMQASPTVPRQAPDNATSGRAHVKSQAAAGQKPAADSPSLTNPNQAQAPDGDGKKVSDRDVRYPVSVRELPPVSVTKDWADRGVWVFSLLLVVVGGLQVWLLWRTFGTIQRQANDLSRQVDLAFGQLRAMHEQITEMSAQTDVLERSVGAAQDSANAAKISADIAVGVSIPTLVVHEFDMGNAGVASLEAMLQFPTIKLVVKNYGQTPAFLRSWSVAFTCEDLPDSPEYYDHPGSGIVLEKVVVQPNESYTLPALHTWERQEFSLEDVRAIIDHRKIFNVYGCVCYWDIFGNPIRRLKFCETAINLFGGGDTGSIGWFGELAPAAYRGTDQMPIGKPTSG
jgi:hypothetical protein